MSVSAQERARDRQGDREEQGKAAAKAEQHRREFVSELLGPECAADVRKFKRCLKQFCGGKKMGGS